MVTIAEEERGVIGERIILFFSPNFQRVNKTKIAIDIYTVTIINTSSFFFF